MLNYWAPTLNFVRPDSSVARSAYSKKDIIDESRVILQASAMYKRGKFKGWMGHLKKWKN